MHSISKFKVGDIVAFNKNTGAFNFNRIIYEYDYGRYDVEIILPDGRSDGRRNWIVGLARYHLNKHY